MGANIGTTITSLSLVQLGDYALPMLFIQAVCLFFYQKWFSCNVEDENICFGVSGMLCPQLDEWGLWFAS